jgi:hypothetical protein
MYKVQLNEYENLLSCSQKPAFGIYSELDDSKPSFSGSLSLIPWSRVLFEKLIVSKLVNNSPFLYGIRRFVNVTLYHILSYIYFNIILPFLSRFHNRCPSFRFHGYNLMYLSYCQCRGAWLIDGVLDRMIGFIDTLYTSLGTTIDYKAIAILTLYSSLLHTLVSSVFTSCILATDS